MEFYCETLSLADCTHELTAAILEYIFCLWPQETSCIEKLVGVISEIRQPMEPIDPTTAHERQLNVILPVVKSKNDTRVSTGCYHQSNTQ